MKSNNFYKVPVLLIILLLTTHSHAIAQIEMVVNSLADDEYAYAWDDPNTPEDESMDGICEDALGRCTIRAAIEESNNMQEPLQLSFSVNGTINLTDILYPTDQSNLNGGGQIELTGANCFEVNYNNYIHGFRFNNSFEAVRVIGKSNLIGGIVGGNVFTNCYIALNIEGDTNYVQRNYFGLDSNKVIQPNQVGIMITGNGNNIGSVTQGQENTICASGVAGIMISGGGFNLIKKNFIGTTRDGDVGYGNTQGIEIGGSPWNEIGGNTPSDGNVISGNTVVGVSISGVPPDDYSSSNSVVNNIIGLNPSQTSAVPNATGIAITNGTRLPVVQDNVIAGNSGDGIEIFGIDTETVIWGAFVNGNRIGLNSNGTIIPNGSNGINIYGNVESAIVGRGVTGANTPNIIVGNHGKGLSVLSQFGFNPKKITFRKNLIYQNDVENLLVSSQSNYGILPPHNLSFNNNTISGVHELPGVIIDIYRANVNEAHPSAYEWLGSTTTGADSTFSFELTDPTVNAVTLTATSVASSSDGSTSQFAYLVITTDVQKEDNIIPDLYSLNQNYPNPFNPTTTISFSIPEEEFVTLKVFNPLGEEVSELAKGQMAAGNYSISFDASELTSGIYFYQLIAGSSKSSSEQGFIQTRKMMVIK